MLFQCWSIGIEVLWTRAIMLEKPTLNPREYLGYDSGFLDRRISNCLDSEENAKCVLVTHLLNPWGVLKGYSPDYDGVDGITRFRNDCVKAFYERANYMYEHDGR